MLLTNLDHGLLEISGVDAFKLLQGQLSCDLNKLEAQKTMLAAHLNPKGRVISLAHVFKFNDAYYLLMPKSLLPIATFALKKYALFYTVKLSDASNTFTIASTIPSSNNSTASSDTSNASSNNSTASSDTSNASSDTSDSCIPHIHTSERFQTISCAPNYKRFITLLDADTPITPSLNWKLADINEKIPTIYPETSGLFLPHDINLPALGAISFDKGCYTGQEIVSRMHYLGKPKKQISTGRIKTTMKITPATVISNDKNKVCGMLVDACQESENLYRILVMVEKTALHQPLFILNEAHKSTRIELEVN